MINYNKASKTYDHTRTHSEQLLDRFKTRLSLSEKSAILDFGCGTGNYLDAIQQAVGCRCCGVEPSAGMREIAQQKNKTLDIRAGNKGYL